MAETTLEDVCEKCGANVPKSNLVMHSLRCGRVQKAKISPNPESSSSADGPAQPDQTSKPTLNASETRPPGLMFDPRAPDPTLPQHDADLPPPPAIPVVPLHQQSIKTLCPYCELDFTAQEMDDHQRECGARTDVCEKCGRRVRLADMEEHLATACSYPPIPAKPMARSQSLKLSSKPSSRKSIFDRDDPFEENFFLPPTRSSNPSLGQNPLGLESLHIGEDYRPLAPLGLPSLSTNPVPSRKPLNEKRDTVGDRYSDAENLQNPKYSKPSMLPPKKQESLPTAKCTHCARSYPVDLLDHHESACALSPASNPPTYLCQKCQRLIPEVDRLGHICVESGTDLVGFGRKDFDEATRKKREPHSLGRDPSWGRLSPPFLPSYSDSDVPPSLLPHSRDYELQEDDPGIPCEFCGLSFPFSSYQSHVDGCQPLPPGEQPREKSMTCRHCKKSIPGHLHKGHEEQCDGPFSLDPLLHSLSGPDFVDRKPLPSQEPMEDMIPCEFCDKPFALSDLTSHQDSCDKDPLRLPKERFHPQGVRRDDADPTPHRSHHPESKHAQGYKPPRSAFDPPTGNVEYRPVEDDVSNPSSLGAFGSNPLCRYCRKPIPLSMTDFHEGICLEKPREPPSSLFMSKPPVREQEEEPPSIPCEFCNQPFPLDAITGHQVVCDLLHAAPPRQEERASEYRAELYDDRRSMLPDLGHDLGDDQTSCFYCMKMIPRRNIISHEASCKVIRSSSSLEKRVEVAKFLCPECGENQYSDIFLANHVKNCAKKIQTICKYCSAQCYTLEALKLHEDRCLKKPSLHLCPYCRKDQYSSIHLDAHKTYCSERPKAASEWKKEICPYCQQDQITSSLLKTHRLTCFKRPGAGSGGLDDNFPKPNQCMECKNAINRPSDHSSFCSKAVDRYGRTYGRTYRGTYPSVTTSKCPDCFAMLPEHFTDCKVNNPSRANAVHSNVSPNRTNRYFCSKCGQDFLLKSTLDTHERNCRPAARKPWK